MRTIGTTKLKRERMSRGILQREFAALLGMAPATLSTVECGHRAAWPKLRRDAARLLGMAEADLFPDASHGASRAVAEAALILELERTLAELEDS